MKGASMGDWGQWPEEAMLPGEGTEDSGERGERRGPLPRPFCPKETLCGMAGSGTWRRVECHESSVKLDTCW